jgi:hypothetical protein
MMTKGSLLVTENKRLQDMLSEQHQAFGRKEIDMHQRSSSYERDASEYQRINRMISEELYHQNRQTEMMQDEYRFTEDKIRQSQTTMSDNDKESNMYLGELQETISQLRRGDVTALDNHNS